MQLEVVIRNPAAGTTQHLTCDYDEKTSLRSFLEQDQIGGSVYIDRNWHYIPTHLDPAYDNRPILPYVCREGDVVWEVPYENVTMLELMHTLDLAQNPLRLVCGLPPVGEPGRLEPWEVWEFCMDTVGFFAEHPLNGEPPPDPEPRSPEDWWELLEILFNMVRVFTGMWGFARAVERYRWRQKYRELLGPIGEISPLTVAAFITSEEKWTLPELSLKLGSLHRLLCKSLFMHLRYMDQSAEDGSEVYVRTEKTSDKIRFIEKSYTARFARHLRRARRAIAGAVGTDR